MPFENKKAYIMPAYQNQIAEIAALTEKFFFYGQLKNYDDAIANARKFAEAFCKLTIFHKKKRLERHGFIEYQTVLPKGRRNFDAQIKINTAAYQFDINTNLQRPRFGVMMLGNLIPEFRNLVSERHIQNAIIDLRNEGNPASHTSGGQHIFSFRNWENCQKAIEKLSAFLFERVLQQEMPAAISRSLRNELKDLKAFETRYSLLRIGNLKHLFENELTYFSAHENAQHQRIIYDLKTQKQALLLGHAAAGKTVTAFHLADLMLREGYQTYYLKIPLRKAAAAWEDMQPLQGAKIMFIIDDCHLDMDTATELYRRFDKRDAKACLLFVSRKLSDMLQTATDTDINLFEELKAQTFSAKLPNEKILQEKIVGIAEKHAVFYTQQYDKTHEIGDKKILLQKVRRNLRTLGFFMEYWSNAEQSVKVLSEIDKAKVLKKVYNKYFVPLKQAETKCFLTYLSLYAFEIPFETLPDAEDFTKDLAKDGLIVAQDAHTYTFDHSETALLLLDAYKVGEGKRFRRYKTLQKLQATYLQSYIVAFVDADYEYPDNLHEIFTNLRKKEEKEIYRQLISNESVKKAIVNFYIADVEENEQPSLIPFLRFTIQIEANNFMPYFEALIWENEIGKAYFFNAKRSCFDYIYFLIRLKTYSDLLALFQEKFDTKTKQQLFENGAIQFISESLNRLKKNSFGTTAITIYNNLQKTLLVEKCKIAKFASLGSALNELKNIDKQKTIEIYKSLNNDDIKIMAENTSFANLGYNLNCLFNIDKQKTSDIYKSLDNKHIQAMAENDTFASLGNALNELKNIDLQKTSDIYKSLNDDDIKNMAENTSFANLGSALNELKNIDKQKTSDIYKSLNDDDIKNMAENASFVSLGSALNELKNIDKQKTSDIYKSLDNKHIKAMAENDTFASLGKALNELKNIDIQKTIEIYKSLDNKHIKVMAENTSFASLGKALNELKNIDKQKTIEIYNSLNDDDIKNMAENASFASLGNALNCLFNIDKEKTSKIYALMSEAEFIEKIKDSSAKKMLNALTELYLVNAEQTKLYFETCVQLPRFQAAAFAQEISHIKYTTFLHSSSILPKLSIAYTQTLLAHLPKNYLFQWESLKRTKVFCQLSYLFFLAEMPHYAQELADFGIKHIATLLRTHIRNVGSLLDLLSAYKDMQPILQEYHKTIIGKVLYAQEKDYFYVSRCIRNIHHISERDAFYYLRKFQERHKNEAAQETIGFIHFYFGKAYFSDYQGKSEHFPHLSSSQLIFRSREHLEIAAATFHSLSHEAGSLLVAEALLSMDS